MVCSSIKESETHIPELHLSYFTERTNDLSSDLVGDVQLRQRHLHRAEEGILLRGHLGQQGATSPKTGSAMLNSASVSE